VTAILPTEALCAEDRCPTYLNDEIIYMDDNHIRRNLTPATLKRLGVELGLPAYLDAL
jgi:hypothetical protein